ncbi:Gfo/Idh/MocA family protein [Paenibacillus thalictri]|uniref:Gfo/Idh/MocA family oxidoreductase n=1 Tax=Paenibacillus thalictri TaxID=2527873 RepID=A0A4Q9DHN0_9BACL|nr:Gfo/Idh/MocA family oxidoreductase [Paenibacillus thalictri]TBL72413.1 Gfo/Idh/MocA family oxidoreductase [Paenibacillus thalictri]
MKPIRLGMVGSGNISNRYFEQAFKLEDVTFAATCARRMSNAEAKAMKYQVPRWYDDYIKMMESEQLDGVVVTTPHSVHAEVVLAALQRGLHVLNEKPMATSFEDCQQMVELAERQGVILMNLPYDLNPGMMTAMEYIREEVIGKFTGAEAQLNIPGPPRDNWYYKRDISHGGAILDCLVYPVSRLIALLGPAKSVMAEVNTLIPQRIVGEGKRIDIDSDVDDNVTLIVEFAGGQYAVIRTLWGTSFKQNNTLIYGRKGTVAINDSGFPLVIHSPHVPIEGAEPVLWRGYDSCYAPKLNDSADSERDIMSHFIHCLRAGEQPKQHGRAQLHVHEIMFGAYRSAESGQRYELTTTFEPWSKPDAAWYDTKGEYV